MRGLRDDVEMPESDDVARKAAEQRIEQQQASSSPEALEQLPAPKTWDEYFAGVAAWLNHHWGDDHNCPHCNNQNWTVGRVVALVPAPGWPSEPWYGPFGFSPAVQVICTQCGHIVLVNALWIFEPQNPLSPDLELQ
jgi:hypothetical protein